MLHLVELQYSKETRDSLLRYFEDHGLTHYGGDFTVVGGWVAGEECVAYLVVKGNGGDKVEAAAAPLARFGSLKIRRVVAIEDLSR